DFHFVENLGAVMDHGELAADEANVVRLPFTCRLTGIHGGCDAAIERGGAMRARRAPEIFEDLDLVPAAEADPAIGVRDDPELHVKLEIPELLLGNDVGGR